MLYYRRRKANKFNCKKDKRKPINIETEKILGLRFHKKNLCVVVGFVVIKS